MMTHPALRGTQGHNLYVTTCPMGCNLQGPLHADIISTCLGSVPIMRCPSWSPEQTSEQNDSHCFSGYTVLSFLFWPSFFPSRGWGQGTIWILAATPSLNGLWKAPVKATGMLLLQKHTRSLGKVQKGKAWECLCKGTKASPGTPEWWKYSFILDITWGFMTFQCEHFSDKDRPVCSQWPVVHELHNPTMLSGLSRGLWTDQRTKQARKCVCLDRLEHILTGEERNIRPGNVPFINARLPVGAKARPPWVFEVTLCPWDFRVFQHFLPGF